uniref:Putative terminase n=1 Tax=viral metagenome TaxID=1070528 RepID=A0A6M3K2J7_9ZZZZ
MKISWSKTIAQFKGRFGVAGIDLSSVEDLTCCVYLFPREDNRLLVDVLMRTWCPESKVHDKKNKYRDQYQAWEREGWLHATEGSAVDYDFVRREIVGDSKIVQLELIGVDRGFDGVGFSIALGNDLGHSEKRPIIITCTNNPVKMGPICQEFERRLLERQINHGGNPILRFMIDSVSVREDADGNKKPDKDKSQGKIDGVVALLYALDRLMRSKPKPTLRMPVLY